MLSIQKMQKALNPTYNPMPRDDFRILDSWVETTEEKNPKLKYMCYKIEGMNPENGKRSIVYKAIKFARVERLPKSARQSTSFMDMQAQVLSAVYREMYNLVTIIANVIKPTPEGIMYLYGLQGVSGTGMEEAKAKADHDYTGFIHSMMGTFRVLHIRDASAEEAAWLSEKMRGMKFITAVRGIPKANTSGEDMGNKGIGGTNINPDSQGTLEEIITALADYEYVIEVLSSPVRKNTLSAWTTQIEKDMTNWNEQLQGQKSLSFNLSLPMTYMTSTGASQGWSRNITDSRTINYTQGESYNTGFSQSVGQSLSQSLGESFGLSKGSSQTVSTGENYSVSQGLTRGRTVGVTEGVTRGQTYGQTIGQTQGITQGYTHGITRGETSGYSVAQSMGRNTGSSLGSSLGTSIGSNKGVSLGLSQGESMNQSFSSGINKGFSTNSSTSTNLGSSYGQSIGNNLSRNYGNSSGLSHNTGISQNENFGQNSGYNIGGSHTDGTSANYGTSGSHGVSSNSGISGSTSVSESFGTSTNRSVSDSIGASHTESNGWSAGASYNHTDGNSLGNGYADTLGVQGNHTDTFARGVHGSVGKGTAGGNLSWSDADSAGTSMASSANGSKGESHSDSYGLSAGLSGSVSDGVSASHGVTVGTGTSHTTGTSQSSGWSQSSGTSDSVGWNAGNGTSHSDGQSWGMSSGNSQSMGAGKSESYGTSIGSSYSEGYGASYGQNQGLSYSNGTSEGHGTSFGRSSGVSASTGTSSGTNYGQSAGSSYGQNAGSSYGRNTGQSYSVSVTQNKSTSISDSMSQSVSQSNSVSQSESLSNSTSRSNSVSNSDSVSMSQSESTGTSRSKSVGETQGESYTQSISNGLGQNWGESTSTGKGTNYGTSEGTSAGTSFGNTGSYTTGTSGSMGLGPSIGYSKSYQWLDQQVKDILEILEYQNTRAKKSLLSGAFYTYVYIACPDMDALATAQAAAISAWQNDYSLAQPIQALNLTDEEQQHLLYHFTAFSTDVTKETFFGVTEHKYATILLPNEYVAYTHLPRVSEGGIDTNIDDIPKFRVPGLMRGDIFMGTQLNAERYTFRNGYRTEFDYRINIDELMHGVFTGQSRSGKTVAAMRFIRELANSRRTATGKRLRIVIMDPKQDWRGIARFVEPERFRFFSLGNTHFRPINLNPCKIPLNVEPQHWIDGMINIYCRAYGLLERGKQMLSEVYYKLYEEAGVFNEEDAARFGDGWPAECTRRSGKVTFDKVYRDMEAKRDELVGGRKAGNDTMDAYSRLLERMSCFSRKFSIEYRLFAQDNGKGIDELIGGDDVTVFESFGLETTFANFIFGIITSGFYKVAKSYEKGFLHPLQYETVLVIEEANKVLTGNDTAGTGSKDMGLSGQSEFEEILDQSAGYGLFIIAITQKISMMPSSIIANCGLLFMGKLSQPEDVDLGIRMVGREGRYDDRDVTKWLPKSPTGWFICRSNRGYDFRDAEPVLVQIAMLNNASISNAELDEILNKRDILQMLRAEEERIA